MNWRTSIEWCAQTLRVWGRILWGHILRHNSRAWLVCTIGVVGWGGGTVSAGEQGGVEKGRAGRTLRVGSELDFPPFALVQPNGAPDGFTVDLWKAVEKEAGLKGEIVVGPFHRILSDFREGELDLLINLAQSEERKGFAEFSIPHVTMKGAIFLRQGTSGITRVEDLVGKSLIVLNADLAHDFAVLQGWGDNLILVDDLAEGFKLLSSGKGEALLAGRLVGWNTIRMLDLRNIEALTEPLDFSQKFSFAVHKGDSDLLAKVNEGLSLVQASGQYEALYEKWFGVLEPKGMDYKKWIWKLWLVGLGMVLLGIGYGVERRRRLELKQSHSLLQATLESAADGIIALDRKGNITHWNSKFVDLWAVPKAMMVEQVPVKLLDWCCSRAWDGGALRKFVLSRLGKEEKDPTLLVQLSSDRYLEVTSHSRTLDSRFAGQVLSFRDVSSRVQAERLMQGENEVLERKVLERTAVLERTKEQLEQEINKQQKVQRELRLSEDRYRDLFENTHDVIQSVSPDGKFQYVNRAWHDALGYTEEDLRHLNLFDLIAPECREHCGALFQRLMKGEDVGIVEVTFLAKDGRPLSLEGTVNVRFENGVPMVTRSIFRDVTSRRMVEVDARLRAEQTVRFQEVLLRMRDLDGSDLESCFEEITAQVAYALRMERVGIWLFDTKTECLECHDLFSRSSKTHKKGIRFEDRRFPKYFEQMRQVGIYRVLDTECGSASTELLNSYLLPYQITSKIDVALCGGEGLKGVLSCEQVGKAHQWTQDEEKFVLSVAGYLALALEMTERRRAEEERNRFFTLGLDMFCIADQKGFFRRINPTFSRVLGYSLEELTSRPIIDFVHPADRHQTLNELESLGDGKATEFFENRYLCKDGQYRWLAWTAVSFPDQGVIYASARDVTELKNAEQQLKRLSLVAERTDNAVIITDAAGHIEWVNTAFTRITEYTQEEVLGKKPGSFLQGLDTDPITAKKMGDAIRSRQGFEVEILNYSKSGKRYWLEIEAQPLWDVHGGLTGFMAIEREITERKDNQAELLKHNSDLELAVAERTLELTESERRHRTLLSNLRGMAYRRRNDESGHFLFASEGSRLLLGLEPKQVVEPDFSLWDWVHEADREGVRSQIRESIEKQIPYVLEYRLKTEKGEIRWVWEQGQGVGDDFDKVPLMEGYILDISERKQAELALSESEMRYQRVVENISDGLMVFDEDGKLTYVNDRFLEIHGISREEFESIQPEDLINPQYRQAVEEDRKKRLRGEVGSGLFEYEGVRMDRGRIWLEVQTSVLMEGWRATGTQSLVRDVTDRHQTQEALLSLSGNRPEDGNDFFERTVQVLARILEVDYAFIGGLVGEDQSRIRMIAFWSREGFGDRFECCIEGTPCGVETSEGLVYFPRGVSAQFPHQKILQGLAVEGFMSIPLYSGAGQKLGVIGVMSCRELLRPRQISAILKLFAVRTGAEIERRKLDQQFQDLFEFASDANVMVDRFGRITLMNRQAEALFGWSREDLLGKPFDLLVPGNEVSDQIGGEKPLAGWVERFQARRDQSWEAWAKDGKKFPAELTLSPLESEDGMRYAVGIRDLSEKLDAERFLLRTQRLESIGTLAGGVAHDLNNTLVPIFMSVELLRMDLGESENEELFQKLQAIETSARRASDMVRQLLTFAKGVEGKRIPIPAADLLHDLKLIIKSTFPKNIRLQYKVPSDLPEVKGDPTQLHQVLLNLCVNARDAMPQGGNLTLSAGVSQVDASYMETTRDAKPGEYVYLKVADTGCGIPSDVVDRIFEPFFTTKEPDKGTGLGLSTALGIVKAHKGFMRVASESSKGTEFMVYLPTLQSKGGEPPLMDNSPDFKGNGQTILVVDDEVSVREVSAALLERLNFKVITACDGGDALGKISEYQGELWGVITDMNMPMMDGLSFYRVLRKLDPDLPVIVVSGRLEDRVVQEFRNLGVILFLEKPFSKLQLIEVLRTLLQFHQDQAEVQEQGEATL